MPDTNGGRTCRRQLLRGVVCAALLVIGGLTASPGVSPVEAADTLRGTDIEVPAPLPTPIRADSDPVPDAAAGGAGGGEASPTTVPPAPEGSSSPGGVGVTPSSPPEGATSSGSAGGAGTKRSRPRGRSTPAPAAGGLAPTAPAVAVVDVDDGDATVERLREATVPAARQFGLPLVLGAIVLAFLAVQGRVDRRDAKLMAAPVTVADDLLPFL